MVHVEASFTVLISQSCNNFAVHPPGMRLALQGAEPFTCGGFMKTRLLPLGIPLMLLAAAACSDGTTVAVSLAVTTAGPLGAPLAAAPLGISAAPQITTGGDSTVITFGNDTIVLRSAELVLRE